MILHFSYRNRRRHKVNQYLSMKALSDQGQAQVAVGFLIKAQTEAMAEQALLIENFPLHQTASIHLLKGDLS